MSGLYLYKSQRDLKQSKKNGPDNKILCQMQAWCSVALVSCSLLKFVQRNFDIVWTQMYPEQTQVPRTNQVSHAKPLKHIGGPVVALLTSDHKGSGSDPTGGSAHDCMVLPFTEPSSRKHTYIILTHLNPTFIE